MSVQGDIIDHMLTVLGESGVSYEASLHPTVQVCVRVLRTTDKEFQGRGWWFNREHGVPLVPDNRGEILVPSDSLSLSVYTRNAPESKQRYTRRNNKLYDNVRHSYVFNGTVYADMIVRLPLDDLPPAAENYLLHKSAENVFLDQDGDGAKLEKLERKTAMAWQQLKAIEMKETRVNALDTPVARSFQTGWRPYGTGRNPNIIGGR